MAGVLLSSCTYLQDRTRHEISGVVINPDNGRPMAGVTLVLTEDRHPFIPFPFATDYHQTVAHTISDSGGRFSLSACVTDLYWIVWEAGGFYARSEGYRESELSDMRAQQVIAKLFARPSLEYERKNIAWLIEEEDSSLTESCT